MLALARDVFGAVPGAWWLTIPVVEMAAVDQRSPLAQSGAEDAIQKLVNLAGTLK